MPPVGADDAVVVDQWALVRLGIKAVLQGIGVRVRAEEANGRDGLLRARSLEPGVLVLGAMADLTAVEAVAQAHQLPVRPRVLVLVSAPTAEDLRELLPMGPDGVLVRSAGAEEVRDAVTRIRAGERVVAPGLVPAVMDALQAGAVDAGPLTTKEQEVLARLAEGHSNQQIAAAMFVTPATVKTHLSHIYAKLGVANRREALARAVALGLLR
jgi:DNA-binding NarL/FixJ family response regulator